MRAFFLAVLFAGAALAQEAAPAAAPAPGLTGLDDGQVQRIHVVEKRPFTEAGRGELSLVLPVQVNPKFTVHAGVALEAAYHLRENLAAQVSAFWFPLAVQSTLSEELLTKANEAPDSAEAFLLQGGALAGLELMPVYGKLNVFDGKILRLGFYLNAGLGVAKTRLQIRPSNEVGGRQFGDTGLRPMGALGAGFRVFVNERFTVRLELRDLAYSGYVSNVNGCDLKDVQIIGAHPDANYGATSPSAACDVKAFGAYTPGTNNSADIIRNSAAGAADLLKNPSADVINNLVFQGGVSWLF